jgi:hypothetical protein
MWCRRIHRGWAAKSRAIRTTVRPRCRLRSTRTRPGRRPTSNSTRRSSSRLFAQADYITKLATVMAGNDLPDIMMIPGVTAQNPGIAYVTQFLEAKAADLTPCLAGDAAKDYPNLAALPSFAWKGKSGLGPPVTGRYVGYYADKRHESIRSKSLLHDWRRDRAVAQATRRAAAKYPASARAVSEQR